MPLLTYRNSNRASDLIAREKQRLSPIEVVSLLT